MCGTGTDVASQHIGHWAVPVLELPQSFKIK